MKELCLKLGAPFSFFKTKKFQQEKNLFIIFIFELYEFL